MNSEIAQLDHLQLDIELPLLNYTAELFAKTSFSDTLVICVQHIILTTHTLFKRLFEAGLGTENLVVLGKCYSTNPFVFDYLKTKGVKLHDSSLLFDSHNSYDEQFDKIIDDFLKQTIKKYDFSDYKKVIFLDDGGHLISGIHRLNIKFSNLIAIEQTTAGYRLTKDLSLKFPVINLAKSWAKLVHETPFIVDSALRNFDNCLSRLISPHKSILILGKGTIGSQIFENLRKNAIADVFAYDLDQEKSCITKNKLPQAIERADIILGCTGTVSLPKKMHQHISPPTTLISLSSSDREFDAVHFRKKMPPQNDCHKDLLVQGITLLNCGFPVNFSNDYNNVDGKDFQLTRSLIFGALVQALVTCNNGPGYCDLDEDIQHKIVNKFLEISQPNQGI